MAEESSEEESSWSWTLTSSRMAIETQMTRSGQGQNFGWDHLPRGKVVRIPRDTITICPLARCSHLRWGMTWRLTSVGFTPSCPRWCRFGYPPSGNGQMSRLIIEVLIPRSTSILPNTGKPILWRRSESPLLPIPDNAKKSRFGVVLLNSQTRLIPLRRCAHGSQWGLQVTNPWWPHQHPSSMTRREITSHYSNTWLDFLKLH